MAAPTSVFRLPLSSLAANGAQCPYTNMLQVDKGAGKGDYTTISAAIAAAVAAGAVDATPWVILINQGTYEEDVTVPAGINLIGQGWGCVRIVPQTAPVAIFGANSWTTVQGINVQPASNTLLTAIELTETASGHRIELINVRAMVSHSVNDAVAVVRVTSASTNASAFARAIGCYFYAQNHWSGAVTYTTVDGQQVASSKAVIYHFAPGSKPYIEAFGGTHGKTSTGNGGTGSAIEAWNQGTGSFTGLHGDGDWAHIWSSAPFKLVNENPNYQGGMMGSRTASSNTKSDVRMANAHADAAWALMSAMYNKLRVYGDIRFPTAPGYADFRTYATVHPTDELDRIHVLSSYNLLDGDVKQVEGKAGFRLAVESEWEDTIEMNFDHTLRDDDTIRRILYMRAHVDTGEAQWTLTTSEEAGNKLTLGTEEPSLATWKGDSSAAATRLYVQNDDPNGAAIFGLVGSGGIVGGMQSPGPSSANTWAGISLADTMMLWAGKRMLFGTYNSDHLTLVTNSVNRGGIKADGTWYQVHGGGEYTIPRDALPWSTVMPLRSGQAYGPWLAAGRSAATLAADTCTATPFAVPVGGVTLNALYLEVTTLAASSTVRLGIYQDDGQGRPGTLMIDGGTVDSTTTGSKSVSISLFLPAGLYWLAAAARGGSPSVRTVSGGAGGGVVPQPAAGSSQRNGYIGAHSADALASTFSYTSTGSASAYVVVGVA